MTSRFDFYPLTQRVPAHLAVTLLETFDFPLKGIVDLSLFHGRTFSVLVLEEYTEQCRANGVMRPEEIGIPNWARNNFDRSPYHRIGAIQAVFSRVTEARKAAYVHELAHIESIMGHFGERIIDIAPPPIWEERAFITPVPLASAAGRPATAFGGRHVPVGTGGASWPTSPRAHVPVGGGVAPPYGFPVASRAAGAPASRGPVTDGHVGVGSRR